MAALAAVEALRAEGNAAFSKRNYGAAAERYTAALRAAADVAGADHAAVDVARVLCLNNRALCALRRGCAVRALDDTWQALRLFEAHAKANAAPPAALADAHAKALLRRAAAFEALGAAAQAAALLGWGAHASPAWMRESPLGVTMRQSLPRLQDSEGALHCGYYEAWPRHAAAAAKRVAPAAAAAADKAEKTKTAKTKAPPQAAPQPPPRRFAAAALLPASPGGASPDAAYLFAGCAPRAARNGVAFDTPLNDFWRLSLDADSSAWQRLPSPSKALIGAGLASGGVVRACAAGASLLVASSEFGSLASYTHAATPPWRLICDSAAFPPGALALAASADGARAYAYDTAGGVLRVRLRDGHVTRVAAPPAAHDAQNAPSLRGYPSFLITPCEGGGEGGAQACEEVVLWGGAGGESGRETLNDCWSLRCPIDADANADADAGAHDAAASPPLCVWRRLDGDGGGVPPPGAFGAAAFSDAAGAVIALFGGCGLPTPGSSCHRAGCSSPIQRATLHLLRRNGAYTGWQGVRLTGDPPAHSSCGDASAAALFSASASRKVFLLFAEAPAPLTVYRISLPHDRDLDAAAAATACVSELCGLRSSSDNDDASDEDVVMSALRPTLPPAELLGRDAFVAASLGAMGAPMPRRFPGTAAFEALLAEVAGAAVCGLNWDVSWSALGGDDEGPVYMLAVNVQTPSNVSSPDAPFYGFAFPSRTLLPFAREPAAADIAWALLCECNARALARRHASPRASTSPRAAAARCRRWRRCWHRWASL
jgi:YD repeat-containing protein